jgi:hypothetical protein
VSKIISQYQEGDIVGLQAIVTSVNEDGIVTVELDLHFAEQIATGLDADLTLVRRPLKQGDPVTWGARKPRHGTFHNTISPTLSLVLKEGGDPNKAEDLDLVNTLDLKAGVVPTLAKAA